MELVVHWTELVSLIEPYAPESGCRGQQPFAVQTMLRINFMQQWFKLSDPAMEEALLDVPTCRDFAGLSHWDEHFPSESSIPRFRHLLERHKLATQIGALRACRAAQRHGEGRAHAAYPGWPGAPRGAARSAHAARSGQCQHPDLLQGSHPHTKDQ